MEDVYKTTDRENRHNDAGEEILNPTPMQPPVGYKPIPSLLDTIRQQIRAHHLSNIDMDPETEEEADDFDIEDDPPDPHSRWENDLVPSIKETRARIAELEEYEKRYLTQTDAVNIAQNAERAQPAQTSTTTPSPRDEPQQ